KKEYLKKLTKFININKIDIVIVTGPVLISCIEYLKKNTEAICIGWIHNNYNMYVNKYSRGYTKEFFRGLQSADVAVCLTKSDLEQYSKINSNAICIYNPLTIANINHSSLVNK